MNGNMELECFWCGEDIEGEPAHWNNERPYHPHCRHEEIVQQAHRRVRRAS